MRWYENEPLVKRLGSWGLIGLGVAFLLNAPAWFLVAMAPTAADRAVWIATALRVNSASLEIGGLFIAAGIAFFGLIWFTERRKAG